MIKFIANLLQENEVEGYKVLKFKKENIKDSVYDILLDNKLDNYNIDILIDIMNFNQMLQFIEKSYHNDWLETLQVLEANSIIEEIY